MHTRQDAPNVECNSIEDSTTRNLIIFAVAGLVTNAGNKPYKPPTNLIKRRLSWKPIYTPTKSNLHKEKIKLSQQYTVLIKRRNILKTKVEEKMQEYQREWNKRAKTYQDPNAIPKMSRWWNQEVFKMNKEADSLVQKIKQKEQEWLERLSQEYNELYKKYNNYNKIKNLDRSFREIHTDSGTMTVRSSYQIQKELVSLKKELDEKYDEIVSLKKELDEKYDELRGIEKLKIGELEQKILRFQLENTTTMQKNRNLHVMFVETLGIRRAEDSNTNPMRGLKRPTHNTTQKKKCDACSSPRYTTSGGCGGTICSG